MTGRSERITFANSRGELLAARLELPAGAPRCYALFAHCFSCSKDGFAAARISRGLAARGVAVLRFDFTGLGASEGEFANSNFSSNLDDLVAAADFLRERHEAPGSLVGHSFGGAAVLAAAPRLPEAAAVATIGAPFDAAHVVHLLGEARAEIEARGEAEVTLGGRTFRIKKQFLDDIAEHQLGEHLARLKKALMVFHAPRDEIVGIANAGQIFAAARHPKSFISLDDADHLLTRRTDAELCGRRAGRLGGALCAGWRGRGRRAAGGDGRGRRGRDRRGALRAARPRSGATSCAPTSRRAWRAASTAGRAPTTTCSPLSARAPR